MRNQRVIQIVFIAMFIALVYVATNIGFPTPGSMGGYVHIGTLVTLVIAIKYGKYAGALAGGIGAAMFDIFSLWILWAPGTLIIRLILGYVAGSIAESKDGQGENIIRNVIAVAVSGVILVSGYFVYQLWFLKLLGDATPTDGWLNASVAAIPGNITQIIVGAASIAVVRYLPKRDLFKKAE